VLKEHKYLNSEAPMLKPIHILKNVNYDDKSLVLPDGISFPHLFSAGILTFVPQPNLD
jgi:hypothetical protein